MEDKLKAAQETAALKAVELSEQLKIKVYPLVFIAGEDKEPVIGYMKEPSRAVKYAVMDKSLMGAYSASSEMLEVILVKEHSDPRILSDRSEDDIYNLGASMEAYNLIKVAQNQADKKK